MQINGVNLSPTRRVRPDKVPTSPVVLVAKMLDTVTLSCYSECYLFDGQGVKMEEIKGFFLKEIMWNRPKKITVGDDLRTLVRERLITIGLFNELNLFHEGTEVTEWTNEIYRPTLARLKELNRAFNTSTPDQFHRLSLLNAEAVKLLNKEIPNVYWLSETTSEKKWLLWGDPKDWTIWEEAATEVFEEYRHVGK